MGLTYNNVLEKVESREIDLLEGIVKSGLGKEYRMSELEQIIVPMSMRARKTNVPIKAMRYSRDGETIAVLDRPGIAMGIYLRVFSTKNTGLETRDTYLGTFPSEKIAFGLDKFKKALSCAKNIAYSRLQTAKKVEDIEDCVKVVQNLPDIDLEQLKKITEDAQIEVSEKFDYTNLYEVFEKIAQEAFGEKI